jgi:hypothetical protein
VLLLPSPPPLFFRLLHQCSYVWRIFFYYFVTVRTRKRALSLLLSGRVATSKQLCCVHVCAFVYMDPCMCMCICVYASMMAACMDVCVCVSVYACIYAHMYTYTCMHICTRIHVCTYVHVYMMSCVCACTYTYTHAYMLECTYTHTHAYVYDAFAPFALVRADARPPHSLHLLLSRWCGQILRGFLCAACMCVRSTHAHTCMCATYTHTCVYQSHLYASARMNVMYTHP